MVIKLVTKDGEHLEALDWLVSTTSIVASIGMVKIKYDIPKPIITVF